MNVTLPEWIFEFHGHRCPFVPIGYRMSQVALRELGMEREKNSNSLVHSEIEGFQAKYYKHISDVILII